MRDDPIDWAEIYDPDEESIGEASAEGLCQWLQDTIYAYASMAPGMTDAICLGAIERLLRLALADDQAPSQRA